MIKDFEIRMGNYVQNHNGCAVKVNFHFFAMLDRLGGESNGTFGIPLTPEGLEKCGFKKYSLEGPDPGFVLNGISITAVDGGYILFEEDSHEGTLYRIGKAFYFLHQLQNLFYSLTGEELEVRP